MADLAHSYAEIIKYDKNDDGTLLVYGKATDDSLDIDQQICDAGWLDRAMPEWFKSGGNIREQHSQIAAGVAQEYEAKKDGHYISALVVDPVSVKKVENRVLKGFSIGIKAPRVIHDQKAANGRIIDGQIVEVSLVDRPANPNAQLMLAKSVDGELAQVEEFVEKREFSTEERENLAESGAALPDGSYPIKTVADLKNALQSFGRAKDKQKVKEHIIRRARALDAVDQLPEDWNVEKTVQAFIAKFDKPSFEAARDALARLIQVEAGEMAMGHDERMSLHNLLEAVTHLMAWYEGEKFEGEVELPEDEEVIEMAAKKDADEEDDEPKEQTDRTEDVEDDEAQQQAEQDIEDEERGEEKMCKECGKSDKLCKCNKTAAKSADGDEADAPVVEDAADDKDSDDATSDNIEAMVEKAVQDALANIKTEVASVLAAKEAAETKSAGLEAQVAELLTKAVGGGPKRTGRTSEKSLNDHLVKAANYRAKAAAATDPLLAKGFRALAEEFESKAQETETK